MNITDTEIIETVRTLNTEVFNDFGEELECFEAGFNGTTACVLFMGKRLWTDDDDLRNYDDETDTYEPLEDFLRREAADMVATLHEMSTLLWASPEFCSPALEAEIARLGGRPSKKNEA